MTRKEAERLARQTDVLRSLGFTAEEAEALRRISMTLQRWHELECGTGEGQVSRSIERDENGEGKPYLRVQYPTASGYVDRRTPIPDREKGALKRLAAIIAAHNSRGRETGPHTIERNPQVSAYIQTDPRGAALYILRPSDVPAGADASAYYSHGVCVY
jgi:hypothetical protein